MPIDDQQKNTLVINASNLMRHSHVKVDVQRFSMAFRAIVEELEPGQPVDLEPLFFYLTQQPDVTEIQALELCIVIASRTTQFGVPFTLPLKAQNLNNEAVEHIVGQHKEKRSGTGSWDVRNVNKEPEKLPGKATTEPVWAPDKRKKKKPGMSQQKKLLIALGVSMFSAIVFHSWLQGTKTDPIVQVTEVPVGGLPCTTIVTNGKVAICTIPSAFWTGNAPQTVRAKATLTRGGLRSHGVNEVWVRIDETKKIVMVDP